MNGEKTKATTDFFLESLDRLSDKAGPLQRTLQQLQAAYLNGQVKFSDNVDDCLRSIRNDLSSLQVGSKRVVRQYELLQGLVHTSALITSSLEVDKVLEEVMDRAIELTNAERAYLVLRDSEHDELEIRAARNWDRENLSENDLTFSRGVIQTALETREPILTINAQGDSRFQGNESVLVNDLRSILCIPLVLRHKAIGVLYADNRSLQGIFDEGSVQLLGAFANQAAIAIENARHFGQLKSDLAEVKKEVSRLQIEINEQRLATELHEITETDYFQRLSGMARSMRQRRNKSG